MELLFAPFLFSSGIGKRISAEYDKKVPECTEFLLTIQTRAQADLHKRQKTSHQGGYINDCSANNTIEILKELYKLAQATAEDRAAVNNLMTNNSTFPKQVTL